MTTLARTSLSLAAVVVLSRPIVADEATDLPDVPAGASGVVDEVLEGDLYRVRFDTPDVTLGVGGEALVPTSSLPAIREAMFTALADRRWDYRSTKALAKAGGIGEPLVEAMLARTPDLVRRRDGRERTLWTLTADGRNAVLL